MEYKLNIQNFAEETFDPRAVKGARTFISENFPPTIATDEVLGVRSSPDLGGGANTVEATTLKDIVDRNVEGTQGATEVEYTFALGKKTMEKQLSFIGKTVWIVSERADSTKDPSKFVEATAIQVKLGGLTPTGQTNGNLEEFTQSGTQVSDESYWCVPDSGGTSFEKVIGMTSGVDKKSTLIPSMMSVSEEQQTKSSKLNIK